MDDNLKSGKNELIDKAMDKIRNKYGSEIITVASLVKKEKSES
jgi:cell division protein YceG involved in septum cleavage